MDRHIDLSSSSNLESTRQHSKSSDQIRIQHHQKESETTGLMHGDRMTYGRALMQMLALGIPIASSHLLHIGNAFLGVWILSQVDEDTLAASGAIETLYGAIISGLIASLSTINYHAALADEEANQNDISIQRKLDVGKVLRAGYLYGGTLAAIIVAISQAVRPILKSFGQSDVVADISQEYYDYLSIGIPAIAGMFSNREFLNGLKLSTQAFTLSAVNVGLSSGLGYQLAIKEGMGARGLALGNTIGAWSTFLLGLAYFKTGRRFREFEMFNFKKTWGQHWGELKRLTTFGLPFIGIAMIDYVSIMAMTLLVGRIDDRNLIAQSVINQYYMLCLAKSLGVVDASYNLIGRAIVSQDAAAVTRFIAATFGISAGIGLSWTVALNAVPRPLMSLFYDVENPENQHIVETFEDIAFITGFKTIAETMVLALKGILVGFNDLPSTAKISFLDLIIIGLPLMIGLAVEQDLSPSEINLTRGSTVFLSMILLLIRYFDQYPQVMDHIYNRQRESHGYSSQLNIVEVEAEPEQPNCRSRTLHRVSSFFGKLYQERLLLSEDDVDCQDSLPQP